MKLFTEVETINSIGSRIRHSDGLMLLGSCFADNMGARFQRAGFRSVVNPLGTLYNPLSVAETVTRMLDGRLFRPEDIQPFGAEGYGTWMAHSLLSRPSPDEALAVQNERMAQAAKALRNDTVWLIVTFGTAWVYRLKENPSSSLQAKETGMVVANCHHEPASRFVRQRIDVDDIVSCWLPLLERLEGECPQLRIIFTVSPIRHLRDGAHGNQLSKATLLMAVEEFIEQTSRTAEPSRAPSYFPAYEIMVDELRDYRFYAADMVHPSAVAEEFLWQRFADTWMNGEAQRAAQRIEKVTEALEHRPLHPESDEYQRFLRQTMLKIEEIRKEFPYFEARNLIDRCHTLLNN